MAIGPEVYGGVADRAAAAKARMAESRAEESDLLSTDLSWLSDVLSTAGTVVGGVAGGIVGGPAGAMGGAAAGGAAGSALGGGIESAAGSKGAPDAAQTTSNIQKAFQAGLGAYQQGQAADQGNLMRNSKVRYQSQFPRYGVGNEPNPFRQQAAADRL